MERTLTEAIGIVFLFAKGHSPSVATTHATRLAECQSIDECVGAFIALGHDRMSAKVDAQDYMEALDTFDAHMQSAKTKGARKRASKPINGETMADAFMTE